MNAVRQRCLIFPLLLGSLILGCDGRDPLAPDADQASLSARGGPGLDAPANLASTAVSASQMDLAWQDNSTSETGFEVHRSTTGPGGTFALLTTTGANVTSYSNSGLSASTQYCYKARAVAATTNKPKVSAFSNTACAMTPAAPAAPSGLQATAMSAAEIELSWTDNASNEVGFNVERCQGSACTAFVEVAQLGANEVRWSNVGLSASTMYRYRVRARGTSGLSQYSNTVAATTPAAVPPQAPTGTNATPLISSSATITWMDNSTYEDGFRVERSLDGGSTWTSLGLRLSRNTTSAFDQGLPAEQQLCYRVVAFNSYGDSPPSNTDCTTLPEAPTNLIATGVDQQTIDLAWTDNSAVEESYEVQRNGGSGVPYSIIAELTANSTSYRDVGVASDITYSYIVRAKKDGGGSSSSNVANAAAATAPPSAPFAVDARPYGSSAVIVDWSNNSANEDGFRVERSIDGGASWATASIMGADNWRFEDYTRTSEQQVCYRVIAFNSRGDSPPSNTDCTAPAAGPTNLTATMVDAQTIDLTWTDNSGVEDGYDVFVLTTCTMLGEYYIASLPANSTAYRDTGGSDIGGCSIVEYYVAARKDGGYSDSSNSVARPAAPSP